MFARPKRRHDPRTLICDHCGERCERKRAFCRGPYVTPAGWRRVPVAEDVAEFVMECPDCAVAWDLAQMQRRLALTPSRPAS